jgi:mono/diheme cytochrome c family protein
MRTFNLVRVATEADPEPYGSSSMTLPFVRALLRFVLLPLGIFPCLAQAQDIGRGREMAERWCASCHVVARSAQTGRADGLPTFPAIAARQETTAASLRGAMTAGHGRMPDFSLAPRDQEDLIAYISSLRQN